MTSSAKVYYEDRIISKEIQDNIRKWKEDFEQRRKEIDDLNDYCYSVLTIIPNAVWNRLGTAYFENLEDAIEYRLRMIEKGIYAQIRDSVK